MAPCARPRCGRWGNAPGEAVTQAGQVLVLEPLAPEVFQGMQIGDTSSSSYRPAPWCSRLTTRITKGITFQVIETVLDTRYPSSLGGRVHGVSCTGQRRGKAENVKETVARRVYEYGCANGCGEYPDLQYEHLCTQLSQGLSDADLVKRSQLINATHGLVTLHQTRVEDVILSHISGRPQAWVASGQWHAQFGMPKPSLTIMGLGIPSSR